MAGNDLPSIRIDLNDFKLYIDFRHKMALSLHFNSPSRKFYLSLIALVVIEMKKRGKIVLISLEEHLDVLALLNETVGGSAGSSEKENLLPRIYRKWKHALPDLEEAPLFKILGRKKEYEGANGKTYLFTEPEKDNWANLFAYIGSDENVRLKFAIDKLGGKIDDIVITYGELLNEEAWGGFLAGLHGGEKNQKRTHRDWKNLGFKRPGWRKARRPGQTGIVGWPGWPLSCWSCQGSRGPSGRRIPSLLRFRSLLSKEWPIRCPQAFHRRASL